MAVLSVGPLIIILLITFVLLLSFRQTRMVAVILLGSFLVLGVLGVFAYRVSSVSNPNRIVQFNYSQPAVQISRASDGVSISARSVQSDSQVQPNYQAVEQPAPVAEVQAVEEWPGNAQKHGDGGSVRPAPYSPFASGAFMKTWLAIGLVAVVGFVFVGGLVLVIVLLTNAKTRMAGISLLGAGSIILVIIAVGLWYFSEFQADFGGVPSIVELPAKNTRLRQTVASLPPQTPAIQSSQSEQQTDERPNSKELVNVYKLLFNDYKTLTRPLKLEIQDDLKEKVGTLRINVQDIGQITISGSSFLINSIGQALAKAMTERMKEGNPQIDITPANSTKVARGASFPANTVAEQPASANASLKNGTSAAESPSKDSSLETAKAPIASTVESEASDKAVSAETVKMTSVPERPDWVGKPPFLWRAGKGTEFPDYYRVVHAKPVDSDPYYYQVVHAKPVDGDAYVMSISTDPYSTPLECEAKIPEVLQSAVNHFVERYPGRQWMGYVQLSPDQLRQLVVSEYEETKDFSFGKMTQVHLLLNFDRKAKTLIDEAIHVGLFNNRAAVAGGGFVALWLLLAVIWGYLKLDLTTKGAYRKRLRAAAGFAILIIVTMGLLVLRSLA
jgi:hypothetical protein